MANEIMANNKTKVSLTLFKDDLDKGFENMGNDDMSLPFIRVLGQLSPQITPGDSKYIDGAKPGMIFNTVTGELFDGAKGISVIPCLYKKEYPEWRDRGEGPGAPVAVHQPNSSIISTGKKEGGKIRLPNGNYVEETAVYCVMAENKSGGLAPALITMKSTQLNVSRRWNAMMRGTQILVDGKYHRIPMHGAMYKLKSVLQKNDKGSWYGWTVEQDRILSDDDKQIYLESRKFANEISKDGVQAYGEEEKSESKTPF